MRGDPVFPDATRDATRDVTLVIPARDAARTIAECLDAAIAVRARDGSRLARILLVDDGSKDGTVAEAERRGIEVLRSGGRGAGAARNAGIREAATRYVWFVDSDCVAEPDALDRLLPHLDGTRAGGVSGTYGIAPGATLLERLIHEEIMVRHARMCAEVDFLATFNVLYRREILEGLGGFDERYLKGQDAELSFRVLEGGHALRFERNSVVRHFHADRVSRYLRVQRGQGYWRVALHLEHRGHARGDSYSSLLDHAQPFVAALLVPVAVAAVATTALSWVLGAPDGGGDAMASILPNPLSGWTLAALLVNLATLLAMQLPMALAMTRRAGMPMLAFVPLGAIRAVARAIGLVHGLCDRALGRGAIARAGLARQGAGNDRFRRS